MDNEIRIPPATIIATVIIIVACIMMIVFGGFCAHHVNSCLHREKQFNEDREIFTFIRTWCDKKLVHLQESHEKELARLHEQFKSETMKNEKLIKDCKDECEKRISKLESELNKSEERSKDCHIGHRQIVSKLVDDNKEELKRERSLFDKELNKSDEHTKDCLTVCEQKVSKLVDDNKKELERQHSMFDKEVARMEEHTNIKQQNECGAKMNYLERELREIIDVVKKELEICRTADARKGVLDHALNLLQSIVCYQTLVPMEMCHGNRQQRRVT